MEQIVHLKCPQICFVSSKQWTVGGLKTMIQKTGARSDIERCLGSGRPPTVRPRSLFALLQTSKMLNELNNKFGKVTFLNI